MNGRRPTAMFAWLLWAFCVTRCFFSAHALLKERMYYYPSELKPGDTVMLKATRIDSTSFSMNFVKPHEKMEKLTFLLHVKCFRHKHLLIHEQEDDGDWLGEPVRLGKEEEACPRAGEDFEMYITRLPAPEQSTQMQYKVALKRNSSIHEGVYLSKRTETDVLPSFAIFCEHVTLHSFRFGTEASLAPSRT